MSLQIYLNSVGLSSIFFCFVLIPRIELKTLYLWSRHFCCWATSLASRIILVHRCNQLAHVSWMIFAPKFSSTIGLSCWFLSLISNVSVSGYRQKHKLTWCSLWFCFSKIIYIKLNKSVLWIFGRICPSWADRFTCVDQKCLVECP